MVKIAQRYGNEKKDEIDTYQIIVLNLAVFYTSFFVLKSLKERIKFIYDIFICKVNYFLWLNAISNQITNFTSDIKVLQFISKQNDTKLQKINRTKVVAAEKKSNYLNYR